MNKQRPSNRTHPSAFNSRDRSSLSAAYRVSSTQRSGPAPARKNSRPSLLFLIWGLVLFQGVAILTAATLLSPAQPGATPPDIGSTLDAPVPTVETRLAPIESVPVETVGAAPVLIDPTPAPVDPSQVVEIKQPETSPTPTPSQPAALHVRGVEITQGIQVFNEPELPYCQPNPDHPNYIFCNNSIPLVAGRHTLVRVYPTCNGDCPVTETVVQLRLLKAGQIQATLTQSLSAQALQRLNTLPMPELRGHLENSVNFEFFPPPDWLTGQITFELEARPQGEVEKSPATLTLAREFAVRKPLRIAYLPIEYQGRSPVELANVDYWLERLYPVPEVEYYRLPMPNLVWQGELNKGEVLHKLLYTYWLYTQSQPVEAWPDQLFGWLPSESYNGGASDPFWCPNCAGLHSSRVAFGGLRPEQDIGGPRILVHEIAHNLGALHAWSPTQREDNSCFKAEGVDIQVDPAWPYAQTPHIQEFGVDLYSNPPIIYPPSFYDMMAYCAQPWISPHTYRRIFNSPFLQPGEALTNFKPQVESTGQGTLLVSGVVYPNGTVSRPEIIRIEGNAFAPGAASFSPAQFSPPAGDDYCLEVRDHNQISLARRCFDLGFWDLETGLPAEASPFFITLPDLDPLEAAQITLSKNEVALTILTPSSAPPHVTITFPNGGEVLAAGQHTFTWQASDPDGDPLWYDVLYSLDGGQSWLPLAVHLNQPRYTFHTNQLPAGDHVLLRVMANDGFYTGRDDSDAPFRLEPPLENGISLSGPATVKPGQSFEVRVMANQMTEPGLFGVQFKLDFDPALLQVTELKLHPELSLIVDQTVHNEAGQVSIVASRQGRVPNLSGDLILATLTFSAGQNEGDVQLHLSEVVAGARGGLRLDISDIQGLSLQISE